MFVPALTLILALASSAVIAAPMVDNVYKRSAASLDPSSTDFPFYFPKSVYENIPYSGAPPSPSSEEDGIKTATDYIFKKLNLDTDDFKVVNSYTDYAGISHVYGAHMANGVRIANHQAAAHVKNGQVTCFSTSFGTEQHLAKRDLAVSEPKVTLSFEDVSVIASTQLKIPVYSEIQYVFEYVAQSDGKVVYTYKFQLRDNLVTKWFQVWCSTTTGEVVQAIDLANKASYRVVQIPHRGPADGFSVAVNPEFIGSSPNGWGDGKATDGNNAIALTPSNKTTRAIRTGVFKTKFDGTKQAGTATNIAAAAVNLFYVTNLIHDITYQYGFTEQAGNFQKDNFGKGGEENDAVIINVFDNSDVDNAQFFTPPDGQPGVMRMHRFVDTKIRRNPGFDNVVVLHEYAHGISNRLTGGPAADLCLKQDDSRGIGEGLCDIIAMIILAKSSDTATTEIILGTYIANSPAGIRTYPYTTDMTVNPLTFGDISPYDLVHDVGEMWASILWEVYWNLIAKYGFATNLYDASQSAGNVVAMKIFIGGLTIQSCNPDFTNARDSIIAADDLHYQGANKCEIYRGFAKRGMGTGATSTRTNTNDFTVPPGC